MQMTTSELDELRLRGFSLMRKYALDIDRLSSALGQLGEDNPNRDDVARRLSLLLGNPVKHFCQSGDD